MSNRDYSGVGKRSVDAAAKQTLHSGGRLLPCFKRCRRECGIHALQSVGGRCRGQLPAEASSKIAADQFTRSLPSGLPETLSRLRWSEFSHSRSVRESNPRQPDYRSGALSTELTGGGRRARFDPMFGTRCADRLSGAERAAGFGASNLAYKLHSRDAGGSRTRSELLCRQPPRRWASASVSAGNESVILSEAKNLESRETLDPSLGSGCQK